MAIVDGAHGPADRKPREQVEDDGEIELAARADDKLGRVPDPALIRCGGVELPVEEIRGHRLGVIAHRGQREPFAGARPKRVAAGRRLAAAARARVIAGGSIEDSMLRVERTEGAVPDGAAELVADLYRRMPDARITDILLEVDDATRFTEAFTHLRTGSPCRDRIGLLNVLLAEGINLGLRKMAEATTTHGFWELMRIARWHVEGEAYDWALSTVVEPLGELDQAAAAHGPAPCSSRTTDRLPKSAAGSTS